MTDDSTGDYPVPEGVTDGSTPAAPEPTPSPTPQTPAGAYPGGSGAAPDHSAGAQARIRELANARREALEQVNTLRAELDLTRRQMQALAGFQPAPQTDPQEQEIRQALERLYPGLAKLNELDASMFEQVRDQVEFLQQQQKAQLDSLATTTLSALYAEAKATYGTDPSQGQKQWLHRAFTAALESDSSLMQRYLQRDPTLVSSFMREFGAAMLDPVRRQAAVTVGQRASRAATVPTGGSSSAPVGSAPPTLPTGDADALGEIAWQRARAQRG